MTQTDLTGRVAAHRRARRSTWAVVLLVLAVVVSACGGSDVLRQGLNTTDGAYVAGEPAEPGTDGGNTEQALNSVVSGADSGPAGGDSDSSGSEVVASGDSAGENSGTTGDNPQQESQRNFASDVGVTEDTIKVGIINLASATSSLGPVIAGSSERVAHAAVSYVNDSGGIAGRRLELVTCDDGGDVSRARACYEQLKNEVFAFVPSETFVTDVIHDQLAKDQIPWLSWGWFESEYKNPWMFPLHANGIREAENMAKWVAENVKPQKVGIMYLNVSEDIRATKVATKMLESHGIEVVRTIAQEWDSTDESSHVLSMRSANPDHVMFFSWATPVAKFFNDASAQNWAPKMGYTANHLTGDPGYGSIFGDYIKDKVTTITSWELQSEDTPENRLYREQVTKYNGNEYLGFKFRYALGHHTSQSAWVGVRIFAQAAEQLGPNLTRAGFKDMLESKPWDTGLGVTLTFSPDDHNDPNSYSFNREYIYKWVGHPDGGYDMERVHPDPVLYE
ncbi:MAG: ABC transporter substrate-binding protein [Actinobacteria bacterium]|nr:ABC transporter substrate-binding protein [Actinomycetota bacterium]